MLIRILSISFALFGVVAAAWLVDCNEYALRPDPASDASVQEVPLDPASPWPKFRADARQTGRSAVRAGATDARPWTFATGKGVFSSPVVDADGTAYIGSADHAFYAIRADGSLAWKFLTGEIIDSSALLDDRGRVYVPSRCGASVRTRPRRSRSCTGSRSSTSIGGKATSRSCRTAR
jgi:outer membrane protein assembly factor BamB